MRFRLGALLALVVMVGGVSAASATGQGQDEGDGKTITVMAKTVKETVLDLGDKGDSQGDRFVFSADLFEAGKQVGHSGVDCVLTRLEPTVQRGHSLCSASAVLARGQITVHGLITSSPETQGRPFTLAITGGTGAYREARGELIVEELSPTEQRLTFKLIL